MKSALLLGLLTLTACQAPVTSAAPAAPQPATREAIAARRTGYLWISVSTATHHPSIERYKLIDGVPQTTPDVVYDGYGGDVAVTGDGTMYAESQQYGDAIFAFPPNSNQPNRRITIPPYSHTCARGSSGREEITAIAADAAGYLFVGLGAFGDSARNKRHQVRGMSKFPRLCMDVAVYTPTAHGRAIPIQLIRYEHSDELQSLAVDAADDLFVDDTGYEVDEFADAITNPNKTRVFTGGYVGNAVSISTDAKGNLYIASTDNSYKNGRIERYAPNADGSGPPTSTVVLPSGVHLLQSIAERGRVLYVDDVDKGVDLYHARKNGSQSPFYSFAASNVISMATGP